MNKKIEILTVTNQYLATIYEDYAIYDKGNVGYCYVNSADKIITYSLKTSQFNRILKGDLFLSDKIYLFSCIHTFHHQEITLWILVQNIDSFLSHLCNGRLSSDVTGPIDFVLHVTVLKHP